MNALLSLLQSIQQLSQQLHDCLLLEKQALDAKQYERLCELASKKQSLVDQLQALDHQRSNSFPGNDFNQYIENSNDQALIKQWSNTLEVIRSSQQQNEVNGRLLNKLNQLNQETMAILAGRDKQTVQTYNAQGEQAKSSTMLDGIKA